MSKGGLLKGNTEGRIFEVEEKEDIIGNGWSCEGIVVVGRIGASKESSVGVELDKRNVEGPIEEMEGQASVGGLDVEWE